MRPMKTKETIRERKTIGTLLPIIFVLAVVPLVCIIHKYDCGLETNAWFSKAGTVYDFFLYYKSKILLIIGVVLACMAGNYLYSKKETVFRDDRSRYVLICLGCFIAFSLVSVLFSYSPGEAFWGGYEQWEGFVALFTYALIFLFTYAFLHHEGELYVLFGAFAVGALIVGVLGVFQAAGYDYMKSGWMHAILTSLESSVLKMKVALSFEEGMVYSTLYNPNYIGSYVSLALPVMAGLVIWSKKIWLKAVAGLAAAAALVSLYFSQSFTGFIGLAAALVLMAVFCIPSLVKKPKIGFSVLGGVVVIAIVAIAVRPAFVTTAWNRLTQTTAAQGSHMIEEIFTEEGDLVVRTSAGDEVKTGISYKDGFLYDVHNEQNFQNIEKNDLSHTMVLTVRDNDVLHFSQASTAFEGKTYPMLIVSGGGDSWSFLWRKDKLVYQNVFGKLDEIREIPHFGFEGYMSLANGRGYIWSRTFPLLTKHILAGCGADNFVYDYPNNDYVGQRNNGFETQIMTKPHNMYLQIWVQDGFIALLGMLGIFLFYVIDTFRRYFAKGKKGFLPNMGICVFLAIAGFMVVGLANDSTITVTPLYWALLGIGFTINRMAGEQENG